MITVVLQEAIVCESVRRVGHEVARVELTAANSAASAVTGFPGKIVGNVLECYFSG